MRRLRGWTMRIAAMLAPRRREAELKAEIESHLRLHIDDNIAAGMTPGEARRRAVMKLGGIEATKETCREQQGIPWLEQRTQDARYALRALLKAPGFTVVAILTLALGIGANSAIFSTINAVLLKPLGFPEADQLVALWNTNPAKNVTAGRVAPGDFVDWRAQSQSFELMAVTNAGSPITVLVAGIPERSTCQYASAELFSLLRVPLLLGRPFTGEEIRDGASTVLISEGYWRRRFGADPQIIGKPLSFNGHVAAIAGVVPRGWTLFNSAEPDLWRPINLGSPGQAPRDTSRWLGAVARLKPGISRERAEAEMAVIARQLAERHPESNGGWGVRVTGLHEALYGGFRPLLLPLLGAVACVLLIACTNLTNLLLARAATRQKEMAVRHALGASRSRLRWQMLTEALVLALPGCLLGLLVAQWGINLVVWLAPPWIPRLDAVTIDPAVVAFTLGTSLLAALIAALAPARAAGKAEAIDALRSSGRVFTSPRQRRVRSALVVGEIGVALVLLLAAGLLLNSLLRLQRVDHGFETENLLAMEVSLSGKKYWDNAARDFVNIHPATSMFFQQVLDRVENLPPVEAVGMISWLPTGQQRGRRMRSFLIEGQPPAVAGQRPDAGYNSVSEDYFQTMGIRVRQGRALIRRDTEDSPWVVVVNETFARRYFPNRNPLGQRLTLDIVPEERPREIVGVVNDVRQVASSREPMAEMYVAFPQQPPRYPGDAYQGRIHMSLVVRTHAAPSVVVDLIRAQVAELDKDQPIYGVQTVGEAVAGSVAPWRFYTTLLGTFAAVAALLAALGIHGVIACAVAERSHEIGVRMALGASRHDVLVMIFRQAFILAAIGIVLGMLVAQAATRTLANWYYGVTAHDPLTYVIVCLGLLALTGLAVYRPARRATKVDPMVALRNE